MLRLFGIFVGRDPRIHLWTLSRILNCRYQCTKCKYMSTTTWGQNQWIMSELWVDCEIWVIVYYLNYFENMKDLPIPFFLRNLLQDFDFMFQDPLPVCVYTSIILGQSLCYFIKHVFHCSYIQWTADLPGSLGKGLCTARYIGEHGNSLHGNRLFNSVVPCPVIRKCCLGIFLRKFTKIRVR